ncbi:hypothetical protein AB1A81_13390 [Bdellovibrio bacteriovorus]|uniref:Uncharacterized protein n=1 Tax=Bdellovibrio bacteriovorus (strain ATCC 15356 / DSM 50701 / NCIMB 9529 / HD100) TaxID=264462 RepID=Q6MJ68_BDEBA|nr:hypothetical protein [Bdellovibrio bacteriovorus]AHZ85398.1 hypothetical protein EP01_10670 [Bdellovibrio bacteriovorus]BEV69292.1 hypothetical protein Bb109J_c2712 [Bdellovibrio bacteriovorus]CAE80693.1 hypothetical protein predicted by Glimmer/Critica [Bdellovibrio bacteriovorus HD100]
MELWFVLGFLAVAGISVIIYFCLMVFFPEWVGITGKIALRAEQSHREGESEDTGNTPIKG